jgi:hypothetical protein
MAVVSIITVGGMVIDNSKTYVYNDIMRFFRAILTKFVISKKQNMHQLVYYNNQQYETLKQTFGFDFNSFFVYQFKSTNKQCH